MRILYFARARELSGTKAEELHDLGGADIDHATVADVLTELGSRFGTEFAQLLERSTVMVDDTIVGRDQFAVHPVGEEMAVLPPVSGGDGPVEGSDGAHHHQHVGHHGSRVGPLRVAILTVSDRADSGEYDDLTGPAIAELLTGRLEADVTDTRVVPDSFETIAHAVGQWCDGGAVDLVITNGGTGLSVRDVTPEAVRSVLDVEAPGLAELMRSAGLAKTPLAALSRQVAGRRRNTIVVSVPGSVKAAGESIEAIIDLLPHACDVAAGPPARRVP